MKKILALILVLIMCVSIVACGGDAKDNDTKADDTTNNAPETEGTKEPVLIPPSVSEDTLGYYFFNMFVEMKTAAPDKTAEELAADILNSEAGMATITMGMAMPVEPGALTGFDAEITGFKSGAMFAPGMMGAAFVGYIFELEEGADVNAFIGTLDSAKNPAWNVCTTAEMTAIGAYGNTVFFVMCAERIPGSISGEAEIFAPEDETAPVAMALWNAFVDFMTAMPEATVTDVANAIPEAGLFENAEAIKTEAIQPGALEGLLYDVEGFAEGISIKYEGNDSFVGYVIVLEEGLDAQNWLSYYGTGVEGAQVVCGAYNNIVTITVNAETLA